jgi:hypothetical protein
MDNFLDFTLYDLPEIYTGEIKTGFYSSNPIISVLLIEDEFNEEQSDFLSKIMNSIGFDISTELTIRVFKTDNIINISEIIRQDTSKYLIGFGIKKEQVNTQSILNEKKWNHFDSFSLILMDNLSTISKDINLKRKLWVELKNEFDEK